MDDATVRQIKVEGEQGLKAAQVGRPDVAGQHFNKALNHAEDVKDDRTRRDELATLSILFDQCGFPDLCMANSKFLSILARVAILLGLCGARSGRPCFCICWRQSPGSPVPAAPVPWWPNPCSSSTSC